ncbi:hypothetical protein [Paenibacillus silviterrae]|uniref:hypothetical protein n=1 Tax=Paenibacillus silviterrae TaxID=3242194 RepID=UPI002543252D|nr:hypothetical protein [Paenibacillus chinjuensis]
MADAQVLAPISSHYYKSYLNEILKVTSMDQAAKYILKQIRNGHYSSSTSALSDWRDYQKECKQLGMSLQEERYLFRTISGMPHRKTSARIKFKEDQALAGGWQNGVKSLHRFHSKKTVLSYAQQPTLRARCEGKALNHCVPVTPKIMRMAR